MLASVGPWADLQKRFKKSCRTDDFVDRMNHLYTVFLLLFMAILVSSATYVGKPMFCWVPAEFDKDVYRDYTNNYCWISNTYFVPMLDTIPENVHNRQEAEITYYQWVPLILLLQALLFHMPNFLWNILNTGSGLNLGKLRALADDTQTKKPKERKDAIEHIAVTLQRWIEVQTQYKHNALVRAKANFSHLCCFYCNKREGTFLTGLYLCIKVLYIINVIGQFYMLNSFMSMDFHMYGFEYLRTILEGKPMRESPRFPRVTLCDFQLRQLQNTQRWTVQCVLPVNLYNEKVFLFLWFWFFILAICCVVSTIKWIYVIMIKRNNYQYVKKYLTLMKEMNNQSDKALCKRFADEYLRNDGCFVARSIGKNSTEMVVMDVLEYMWKDFKLKQHEKHAQNAYT